MNAPSRKSRFAVLGAVVVGLALPAASQAEYYVPPGNSAANQYTEAFPTAGGESGGKPGKKGKATPAQTLGADNAKRLEDQGPAGKAAAQVAAETAPAPVLVEGGSAAQGAGAGGNTGGTSGGQGGSASDGRNAGGSGSSPGGVGAGQAEANKDLTASGSSGLGEVVRQATGDGNGNLGLLLPIVILATIAGSIAYRLRTRHGQTA